MKIKKLTESFKPKSFMLVVALFIIGCYSTQCQNANHKDWECTEDMMKLTKEAKALYMHCLPADITDVSCEHGEVAASVFDRYRVATYKEASFKPYVIAAMIFSSKVKNPEETLNKLLNANKVRHFE